MSEPARIDSDADVDAAREALAQRMRKGDLTAFEEFFRGRGIDVGTIEWVEPPR
ncbi:MAG TPA: hypothetical protein VNQ77_06240 [Frankiaceae bacterium]|nr:hypothetical protein [Frankiaceae bacterium]